MVVEHVDTNQEQYLSGVKLIRFSVQVIAYDTPMAVERASLSHGMISSTRHQKWPLAHRSLDGLLSLEPSSPDPGTSTSRSEGE